MAALKEIITKNKFLLTLVSLIFTISQATACKPNFSKIKSHKTTLYFGQFKNLSAADFCILYDGEVIDICDKSFSIKDQMLGSLNIIFVDPERINLSMSDDTMVGLKLGTKNYLCYELEAVQAPTPSANKNGRNSNLVSTWKISEKKLSGAIPINSIVVPLNPNNVNITLQNTSWRPSNLEVKLPIIKIEPKDNQAMNDLMLEGYLKCMALKPFHTKQKKQSIVKSAIKISMIS